MIEYNSIILKFGEKGEKTGWRYVEVPADLAEELKPRQRISFRVKGMLDDYSFSGLALTPMGNGNFIMVLKADIRKAIHKKEGAMVRVRLQFDPDYKLEIPEDLLAGFEYDPEALEHFNNLVRSHRDYFIKWVLAAKTDATRAKRIVNTVHAMVNKLDYGQMIRSMKQEKKFN